MAFNEKPKEDYKMASVSSIENSGFQIKTTNGYRVSVRFSTHSYCERYLQGEIGSEMRDNCINSRNAELAVISPSGSWITDDVIDQLGVEIEGDGMIVGYVEPDDISRIIGFVVTL